MVKVVTARNAAEALPMAIDLLLREGVREPSRNGEVLVMPVPIVTVITKPWERVVLSPVRDANPFFHIVEAVWMLAGRDDVDALTPYVKNFARYAEPDGSVYGAYGYRWRRHFGYDQLSAVVEKLRTDPGTRQAVIGMWDATDRDDPPVGADDMRATVNDRPCNTSIMLRINKSTVIKPSSASDHNEPYPMVELGHSIETTSNLDMSVTNRSHDVLWGLLGANAVHFSVLQENLATQLNVGMGNLTFFSNNFHVYIDVLKRMVFPEDVESVLHQLRNYVDLIRDITHPLQSEPYGDAPGNLRTISLYDNALQATQDDELILLWKLLDQIHEDEFILTDKLKTPFYIDVFYAASAHRDYRAGEWRTALFHAGLIMAPDWRMACLSWLERRRARLEEQVR